MCSMKSSSLVIAGSGIKFISHLTIEVKAYIEQSDKVLYLINEPAMQNWIQQNSKKAESLDILYTKYPLRKDCYQEIANYIISEVEKNQHICVVLYGHPTVFAIPALDAANKAKAKGIDTRVLPGISAENCLFADLLIDPGSCGCQSFEATDFLIRKRSFSSTSHLILWQVGMIGNLGHSKEYDNQLGIRQLVNKLSTEYPLEHEIIVYEAAQYPGFESRIEKMPLSQLVVASLTRISTLYIPPVGNNQPDDDMLNVLGIKKQDLRL